MSDAYDLKPSVSGGGGSNVSELLELGTRLMGVCCADADGLCAGASDSLPLCNCKRLEEQLFERLATIVLESLQPDCRVWMPTPTPKHS